ncbi:MAG: lipopolysaccharide assembly protein LapA domain-containing protein [Alphaproteobacteria bacterium]|nr:lipopolysaccharide assembly protein LapA domain-containing protein [Alphaproteobacteria bacterium]MDP6270496.1 lipopolysaccharide assembly protein LapA domain-containing protein [Alphaproteobacteria bacterium]MDP7426565.1 lipopolysaccharide assembly protein LapA domain-containing protein [Alphaproteobacteria bacterium]
MKILTWLVVLPLFVVVAAFAVGNRGTVTIELDPLPLAFSGPLYLVVMAAAFIGLLAGGGATWMAGAKWRREARRGRRRIRLLASELEQLRAQAATVAATEDEIPAASQAPPEAPEAIADKRQPL